MACEWNVARQHLLFGTVMVLLFSLLLSLFYAFDNRARRAPDNLVGVEVTFTNRGDAVDRGAVRIQYNCRWADDSVSNKLPALKPGEKVSCTIVK